MSETKPTHSDAEDSVEFSQPLGISPSLLKAQKKWLLSMPQSVESDGLLNLIDYIQDHLVEHMGVPEEVVFDLHTDAELETMSDLPTTEVTYVLRELTRDGDAATPQLRVPRVTPDLHEFPVHDVFADPLAAEAFEVNEQHDYDWFVVRRTEEVLKRLPPRTQYVAEEEPNSVQ